MKTSLLATAALAASMMFGGQSPSDSSKPADHSSSKKSKKQAKTKKPKQKKAKQTAQLEAPR